MVTKSTSKFFSKIIMLSVVLEYIDLQSYFSQTVLIMLALCLMLF